MIKKKKKLGKTQERYRESVPTAFMTLQSAQLQTQKEEKMFIRLCAKYFVEKMLNSVAYDLP